MDKEQNLKPAIAAVILRRRRQRKLSHESLAQLTGLARSSISRIESEDRIPSIDTVFRLAKAFRMSPHRLVKEIYQEAEAIQSKNE